MSLDDLGWDARWGETARAAAGADADAGGELVPARVIIEHRGAYEVTDGAATLWAELPGRAYFDARDKRELPAVGDWVLVRPTTTDAGAAMIRHVLPRRSLIVRQAAGEKTAPQPIAANVDVGLIVTSANSDLNPRRIERYLILLREGGVRPLIILSKADLVDDPAPLLAELATIAPGVDIAVTSATAGHVDALRPHLGPGVTGVLIGSSGVGKSTLLNLLIGRDVMSTRPVREHDERGRHTTTRRELFALPGGAILIDTPGMRELSLWAEDEDVAEFSDIDALADQCRFADCTHHAEPGCAVRIATTDGTLDPARLASFHKIGAELAAEEKRRDAAARAEEKRRGKVGAKSLRARLRDKGSKD